jgi:hypothetical protein
MLVTTHKVDNTIGLLKTHGEHLGETTDTFGLQQPLQLIMNQEFAELTWNHHTQLLENLEKIYNMITFFNL